MTKLSVVMCTHNPDIHLLFEVLGALRRQTLHSSAWSFLLIDNACARPIEAQLDLSWHQQARIVSEETLGLTHARLRGIKESKSDIIVFVDDDNILENNYLANALAIANEYPSLGAWGGNLVPRYERKPPDWFHNYSHLVAIRHIDCDKWCNIPDWSIGACPSGAGLCIRRCVATKYVEHCTLDPIRKRLGRIGSSLMGCEDLDLAFTACDIGMGTGVFRRLYITHVIPKERFDKSYLLRIEEGNAASSLVLKYLRHTAKPQSTIKHQKSSVIDKAKRRLIDIIKRLKFKRNIAQEFLNARERGYQAGLEMLASYELETGVK